LTNRTVTRNYIKEEPQMIGVIGAGHAMGTTHLCILTANYLCSACGKKTAVLEWNGHGDFARFGSACTGGGYEEPVYRIQEVDFYPGADGHRMADCMEKGYQRIIMDFGILKEQKNAEILRCHKVFLMVSFSEWQEGVFGKMDIWQERAVHNGWQCLTVFGSEESRIRWNKRRRPTILRIPFSVDAFTVTEEVMNWMKPLL